MLIEKIVIETLLKKDLFNFVKFVFDQNNAHHNQDTFSLSDLELFNDILKEETNYYDHSHYFVVRDQNRNIVGGIRTLKHHDTLTLPMEKMFGISVEKFVKTTSEQTIWHIGKFAIKNHLRSIKIFKTLILSAIKPIIIQSNKSIVLAECDAKLLCTLGNIGIVAETVGKSIQYLGSETIPVKLCINSLRNYYTSSNLAVETISLDRSA